MKQKYKSPEMMQEKGIDFHCKLLKKTIKAMIADKEKTIQPFFYNTEFEFGNGQENHPVLYIGELPSKWKPYLKTKKRDETFAHGECIIDAEGLLKLQVNAGKGGKELVLKKINKVLLKPFCVAYIVEDINTEGPPPEIDAEATVATTVENEDVQVEDHEAQNDDSPKNWVNASKNALKEANLAMKANLKILNELEKPMSKLKDIVVTDDFIAKAMKAKAAVIDLGPLALQLESLGKSGETYKEKTKEAANLLSLLLKQIKQIGNNQDKMDLMLKNMEGLKNISNPEAAEIPIIDNDPIVNFLNRTKKVYA